LIKDSERLDLLKEIGGTRVYEENKNMESNNKKKLKRKLVESLATSFGMRVSNMVSPKIHIINRKIF
jgi:hypothetical protein